MLLKKMTPVGPKEKKLLKKMIEEIWSDERLDALHQVFPFYESDKERVSISGNIHFER